MTPSREARIQEFTGRGWWGTDTLDTLFRAAVEQHGEREALVDQPNRSELCDGEALRLTYAELERHVSAWTRVLAKRGIGKGDIVVAQLPNIAEFVILYLAIARQGAVISPLPVQYGAHELRMASRTVTARAYITVTRLKDQPYGAQAFADGVALGARLFLGRDVPEGGEGLDAELAAALAEGGSAPAAEVDANDVYTICWTSGTTGTPKGVPRTYNQWLAIGWATYDAAELRDGDVLLNPFPFVNMASIGGFLFNWLRCGAKMVLHHPLDLPVFLQQIAAEGTTFTIAPPALLNMLLKQEVLAKIDLSRLRAIGSGSAPLSPWMVKGFAEQHNVHIINLFGSNEGISLVSGPREIPDPEARAVLFPRFGVAGIEWDNRVAAMVQTRLVDPDSGEIITAPGQVGELQIAGATIFDGYLGDAAGSTTFTDDGYFHTGDLFEIADDEDPPRHYRFVGRRKEIILRGGYNISPDELDSLLAAHPKLTEAATVGYPDDTLGERVCVFAVPKAGETVTLEDITGFLAAQGLAKFKLPERLEITDVLPRNALGKVVRGELRAQLDG
ncbi:MAG: (2,3-dihydroxybenzoyl)adenylate synthase [Gammaproteobacteria bacterium]|nr:MAG: (2,3-dihydroxybenzoyl)adenylate synthase [Gammaproteobacteria bacterium]